MNDSFETANQKVHPVEAQWHFPIMTKHGFVALTKEAIGFVRAYEYQHPYGTSIRCCTGMNSDYWTHAGKNGSPAAAGTWSELERYLQLLDL